MSFLFIYKNGKVEEWYFERIGYNKWRFYREGKEFIINAYHYEDIISEVKSHKKLHDVRMKYV